MTDHRKIIRDLSHAANAALANAIDAHQKTMRDLGRALEEAGIASRAFAVISLESDRHILDRTHELEVAACDALGRDHKGGESKPVAVAFEPGEKVTCPPWGPGEVVKIRKGGRADVRWSDSGSIGTVPASSLVRDGDAPQLRIGTPVRLRAIPEMRGIVVGYDGDRRIVEWDAPAATAAGTYPVAELEEIE